MSILASRIQRPPVELLRAELAELKRSVAERAVGNAALFARVESLCLFVGYPRSGHTIIADLLRAHRHVALGIELNVLKYVALGFSREEIFQLMLDRSRSEAGLLSNEHSYVVPNQHQQDVEDLRVIGDKAGGRNCLHVRRHPDILRHVAELTGLSLRLVHVYRNPFDNITSMLLRGDCDHLDQAIHGFFQNVDDVLNIHALVGDACIDMSHERFIRDPAGELRRLCAFMGVDAPEDYVRDCTSIVNESARKTRTRFAWPSDRVRAVLDRCADVPFLSGYTFEV